MLVFARRLRTFADIEIRVVDVRLAQVAHVEPFPARGALHEMIGLSLCDAVNVNAFHDRTFGFSPNSSHLRATVGHSEQHRQIDRVRSPNVLSTSAPLR
jgi:hypothetical protein